MLVRPHAAVRRRARPGLRTVLLAAALVGAFVLLRVAFGTSLGGFTVASDDFVDPSRTPDPLPVVAETGGYDGQFVYRLALEPWTTEVTAHGIRLDNPAYRQQRIATPALAWVVDRVPGVSTPLALVLVNVAGLVVAAGYATRLALEAGRRPAWGLVLAFPACMPISLGRDLTEPVAWAAVLAGIWYARRRSWPAAAAALAVAVLARETSLVVLAGLAVGELVHAVRDHPVPTPVPPTVPATVRAHRAARRRGPRPDAAEPIHGGGSTRAGPGRGHRGAHWGGQRAGHWAGLAWLAAPALAGVAWQLLLLDIWGTLPLRSGGSGNLNGLPLLGVLTSLAGDVPGSAAVQVAVVCERLGAAALIGYAAVALLRRRAGLGRPAGLRLGEAVAWLLAVLLALSLRGWGTDVQFLRATNEGLGLSVLVALGDERLAGRLARWLAAAMVIGVALEYVVRQ